MDKPKGNWAVPSEKEIPSVTVSELDAKCTAAIVLYNKIKDAESIIESQKKILGQLNDEIHTILKAFNKIEYSMGELGKVKIQTKKTWRIPQSLNEKLEFFDYLKKVGDFDALVSVNSMTLNSWCDIEYTKAKEKGLVDWAPPGLMQPTEQEKLKLPRRKKQNE